ncbi:sugar lactone lactonase YvrE [Herbihabitans rhizosphaerae]|uniref:Sugar lactone lactonase YvrE n=1 Tax=Herbihabitans rhizosphaerae TaxID=1872711 RepID=A0A4Q7KDG0_9PSEU|nr:SMP-30/gluconolactonase/LRE family protein [Herbihabitans rhizosphaerae]RZS31264.1 sugar lactone lactonase YvrE [Herbihabitans rhizosphaerae]
MRRPKIEPVVWQPPKPSARKPRDPLPPVTVININGTGPEDVVVDEKGHVFTGVDDGRVLRLTADGRRIDTIADTGGRPLGLELHPDGRLLVCDSDKGLLLVDRTSGDIETLVPRGEQNLRVCNNAAITENGTIYFTDSSQRFDLEHWRADILEHSGTGRLLRRDPDGSLWVVLEGLQFANGVALAADESYVAVAETGAYRIRRVWLTGPKAGTNDVLLDNLSGFPDNIARGSDGLIWIAIASPRDLVLDTLHRLHPKLREIGWRLPERVQPQPKRTFRLQAVDTEGTLVHDHGGTVDGFSVAVGVREHDGRVYLGSLVERAIAVYDVP